MLRKILCFLGFHSWKEIYACSSGSIYKCRHCEKRDTVALSDFIP